MTATGRMQHVTCGGSRAAYLQSCLAERAPTGYLVPFCQKSSLYFNAPDKIRSTFETSSMNVIIVDDDSINTALHSALVKKIGYQAISFTDPHFALEWCGSNTVDLLITDYMMPGMNGLELIRQFRNHVKYSEVPIIMVTATSHPQLRSDAIAAGVSNFLNKPLNLMEFMECVTQVLRLQSSPHLGRTLNI
jgi:CheY-like chemotaxis protein